MCPKMERRRMVYDGMEELKKGPWKAEEDEVLIEHVSRVGPRDWSSIRSKGLLHRTGKSCRLRWVNKLRPNLKSGVKFSVEEERTVIDLQAKFGNKWAKIATYLQGRTDNDVKNFWSSRQKRLQRILQTSASKPKHKSQKIKKQIHSLQKVSPRKASKLTSSAKEELLAKSLPCSSSYNHKTEIVNPEATLNFQQKSLPLNIYPMNTCIKFEPPLLLSQFPPFEPDFAMSLEGQEFIPMLGDPNFLDVFPQTYELTGLQRPNASREFEQGRTSKAVGFEEIDDPHTPDSFIDDFPLDMFDQIESLPSPSQW